MPDSYSLQLLLPSSLDRRLARWANNMPGASWPSWGGHITLLPTFQTEHPTELAERMTSVCARHQVFSLRLNQIQAVQDRTRADYWAVMLAPDGDSEGAARLTAFQADVATSTAELRTDLRPELMDMPFWPHVTLALGVDEEEADKMVRRIREDGLKADFIVEQIWLLAFSNTATGEPKVDRRLFTLPGLGNIMAD